MDRAIAPSALRCSDRTIEVAPDGGSEVRSSRAQPLHRIALFSGNFNCVRDGANRALNRLVSHSLGRGHAVRVYSPTVREPAFAPAGDLVSVPSWPIPLRPEYRFAARLPSIHAADVRRFQPSVIHVSAPDGLGAAAIRMARRIGVPVVASVHTRFETYLDYYGLGALRGVTEAWLRRFYAKCDAVLAPSDAFAKELSQIGIEATHVWSRGVDTTEFNPAFRDRDWRRRLDIADHEIALLFFGRLVAEKGLATFEATASALRERGVSIRPLIVGDGPERRRLAKHLPDAVFTGQLDGAALGRAVASADILLNPSLTEAFGNVTLEAMASGVAVIAADTPINRVLIESGRTGLLTSPNSPERYAEAIHRLVANGLERQAIASAAVTRARMFEWAKTLDIVLEAYRGVWAAHSRRP